MNRYVEILREMRKRAWDQSEYHARHNQNSAAARCSAEFDALGQAIDALEQRPDVSKLEDALMAANVSDDPHQALDDLADAVEEYLIGD